MGTGIVHTPIHLRLGRAQTEMSKTFQRLHPRLQTAIVQRLGWSSLRPVQDLAGETLLGGKNAVVLAPTAGGKTEASMFPALSMTLDDPPDGVGVLYVAPIKAMLNNQAERPGQYTQMVGLRRFVWHGDVGPTARKKFLNAPHRIHAHIFLTVLALLLERLAECACEDTWRNIRDDLKQIKLVQLSGPSGTLWQVTEPRESARTRLKKLQISNLPTIVDHA